MGGQGVTKTVATYSMRNWEASCLFWVTLFYLCPIPHFQLAWLPLSILCEPRWPESCHLELDTLGIMGITGKLWQKITARSLSCCLILVSRGATMWVLWVPQDSCDNRLVSCLVLLGDGGHLKEVECSRAYRSCGDKPLKWWRETLVLSCFLAVKGTALFTFLI